MLLAIPSNEDFVPLLLVFRIPFEVENEDDD
jgi:hypothetical protein